MLQTRDVGKSDRADREMLVRQVLAIAIRIITSFFLLLWNGLIELECRFRKLKNGFRIRIFKLMLKLLQELRPLWLMPLVILLSVSS
ncbi:hypothetical protein ISN45_Aa05g012530 [Arabidopsis thaliana x Arabidopsis arenosa]|uniref:Transmembrane protein n=1 Tax=Arabidopsis thaliana x Arabidopsis arenosa TaxID=1240361 RepID=A0A8T1ZMA6_9BRAS|nr:hypothetical protein ISN45_Aa05g012530 [Arabidopsis thaliana x Arabidopsis arenosa]